MSNHLGFIIGCASGLTLCFGFWIFGSLGSTSTFELWIEARKEIKLKQLEVAKLEAEHLQKCPRLTDTPRGR